MSLMGRRGDEGPTTQVAMGTWLEVLKLVIGKLIRKTGRNLEVVGMRQVLLLEDTAGLRVSGTVFGELIIIWGI